MAWKAWQAPMEFPREETMRLVAEDLRATRARLGITSSQAAKRAGLAATRYRALEKGSGPGSQYGSVANLTKACGGQAERGVAS